MDLLEDLKMSLLNLNFAMVYIKIIAQEKTTTTKLCEIHFYFCRAFALFHQGIVITVIFKMLYTFLLKRTIKTLYNNQILSLK